MIESVDVFCKNDEKTYSFEKGTSLREIYESLNLELPYLVVSGKVNNKTESLNYRIYRPKTVEFVDISDSSGMRTYVRSLCFVLAKAVYEILPGVQINIEHPISKGYYCVIVGQDGVSQEIVDKIKSRMQEIIAGDFPFEAVEALTHEVVATFRKYGFEDKALLLETQQELYSKYYKMDGYVDYFYGSLVPSSGYLHLFDLQKYNGGLLLRIPNRERPIDLEPIVHQQKMSAVYKEQLRFLNIIGLDNVGDLNKAICDKKLASVINVSEAYQEKMIAKTAEEIAQRFDDGVRIVLISGPSSSGKTTFRKRLEVQLYVNCIKPLGISLDDYFVDREHTPVDKNGNFDFESLYAIDIEQFNADLNALLKGETVSIPTFNFTTGKQEKKGNFLKMQEDNVLVIEGIHGLNPLLTPQIADEKKFLIYVSALTTISLDNHNWISTTDNRLIRRIVRDYRYRNYSAIDTISRWPSVRAGEEKWIFPYQENADVMFNSAMLYEFAALRRYAEPILYKVPKNAPEYAEAYRLLRFLSYFNYINDKDLPPTSLLREFMGGSSFKY
ncbi:MAG: nucleoside kinase [Dysgonamonadaceae bacterium]